jgi:Xaa-Pro aminopeptidase
VTAAFPAQTYRERLNRLYSRLATRGIHALYLPPSGDLEYLTGFRRRRAANTDIVQPGDWLYGAILIPWRGVFLVSPYMVSQYVRAEAADKAWIDDVLYVPEFQDPEDCLREVVSRLGIGSLGGVTLAAGNRMWSETVFGLEQAFPGLRVVAAGDLVSGLRMVKEPGELELMRKAAAIADEAFGAVLPKLKTGITPLDVATEVDCQLKAHGADWTSFPTGIVFAGAGGPGARTAASEDVPAASGGRLLPGMHIAFDFGAVYQGYCSDFGRTVFCGDPAPGLAAIHSLIMAAQAAGMAALRGGEATGADADKAARGTIEEAGWGSFFWHRLGHGIGCDVHEAPFLTRSEGRTLQPGMTFTVEPSIHKGQEIAIRVEDVVLVTAQGGESFSRATKELTVI